MNRLILLILCFASLTPTARAADTPYDLLKKNYGVYCTPDDPHAFPMKVWGLSSNEFAFWRGSRDLYFTWCRDNTRDWLDDKGAYCVNHGDLHLGNIGSYVREGQQLGAMSFGPVDFDDTANLPFQIELLQGLITLRLTARQNNIDLSGTRREELSREMFDAYRAAVASDKTTLEMVSDEKRIGKFIDAAQKHSYEKTLDKFTDDNGKFLPYVRTKRSYPMPKEILKPAMDRADDMARGIAQAVANSPALKAAFIYSDVRTIRESIKDVALRTRLESLGSQGLKKYLVLLKRPLKGLDMDVVMYVKQEIPAAAERADAIPRDPRSPGERCSQDMNVLTNPTAYLNSWCDIGKESYWVTFKEPWSEELETNMVRDYHDLIHFARVWGTVAGAMHRNQGHPKAILQRLDKPEFFDQLRHRSTLYMAELDREYFDFTNDPRAKADKATAQKMIDAAKADLEARASLR